MTVKKTQFSKDDFLILFRNELRRCFKSTVEKYCVASLPNKFLLYFPSIDSRYDWIDDYHKFIPKKTIMSDEDSLIYLLRDDGWFRNWINISPFGVTKNETLFEIIYSDKWTNKLIVDELELPGEPFLIHGPSISSSLESKDFENAYPLEKLPKIEFTLDSFDWLLKELIIDWNDKEIRSEQARQLSIRLNNFSLTQDIKYKVIEWIKIEKDKRILSDLLAALSLHSIKFEEFENEIIPFCYHPDSNLRNIAYWCINNKSILIDCLKIEKVVRNRTGLIRLLIKEESSFLKNELRLILKNCTLNNVEKRILKKASFEL